MPEANFIENKRKQKKLAAIFVVLLVVTAAILYFGLINPPSFSPTLGDYNIQKPDINFNLDILEDPVLNALEPFLEIQAVDPLDATSVVGEIGRENPFLPF
jgi:hypothetical protein